MYQQTYVFCNLYLLELACATYQKAQSPSRSLLMFHLHTLSRSAPRGFGYVVVLREALRQPN